MPIPGETKNKQSKTLVRGVFVLMPAMLIAKIIGLFYKIPLLSVVGVTGMAYFLSAYHIYALLFVLCAAGLPTALSLCVSESIAAGKNPGRALWLSLGLFLSLGALFGTLLFFFSPLIANAISQKDAAECLAVIAPALLLGAFTGAVKGYFQGRQNMLPTAVSEVLEAAGKLGFGLFFAIRMAATGAPSHKVAAAAVAGIPAGMALSAAFLLLCLLLFRDTAVYTQPPSHSGAIFARIFRVALPVTVGAAVMGAVTLIDTALIPGRLQALGYAPEAANLLYSCYGNLAVPLYNLVPTLLSPITLTFVPILKSAVTRGDRTAAGEALSSAFRLVTLFAVPAALGLSVFAAPVLSFLFRGQSDAVALAAPMLSVLSLSVLPAVLVAFTAGALQAAGKPVLPVVSLGIGALVKLTAEWILLSLPRVQIYGAPISTLLCHLTVLTIQGICLSRILPTRAVCSLFRPFAAAAVSVGIGGGVYILLSKLWGAGNWLLPLTLFLVVLLYLPLSFLFRAFQRTDLLSLPCGERIADFLSKHTGKRVGA